MLKRLIISTILGGLIGCEEPTSKKAPPQHVLSLMEYFDSSRMKEFDTVSYRKKINWGNNFWRITDNKFISYEYQISFPSPVSNDYEFPTVDSLERIWISNQKAFTQSFPLKITLPDQNIDMIMNKDGLIDIKTRWSDNDHYIFKSLEPSSVFINSNPFEIFKSRTKTMDSLGVKNIINVGFSNFITIVIKEQQEFLYYLPNNFFIEDSHLNMFDSIISQGIVINKNWVWKMHANL